MPFIPHFLSKLGSSKLRLLFVRSIPFQIAALGYLGIPLTTAFTPAPTCFSPLTDIYMTPDLQTEDIQFGDELLLLDLPLSHPQALFFPSSWEQNPFAWFSRGIRPSGYTAGCTSTTITIFELTQTGAICCPRAGHAKHYPMLLVRRRIGYHG
jgi:hypothetical protein